LSRRVIIVDYLHAFHDRRMLLQAEALARLGYQVIVIATLRYGEPNYRQTRNGVEFRLTPFVPTRNLWVLLRVLWGWLRGVPVNPLGLPEKTPPRSNAIALGLYTLWAIRLGWSPKADIIHCHEHTPMPAGWLLSLLHRAPLVYDEHDNREWLRIYGGKGNLAERFELFFIKRVDAVTTIGERLAKALRKDGARRVEVVGSWKRLEEFALAESKLTAPRERFGLQNYRLVISCIATLYPVRDIPQLLEAVAESPDVALLIGGSGELEKDVIAASKAHPNIIWLGWVNGADVPLYTVLSDVVYNCIAPGEYDYYLMPNKLFDAMAAGKAMIVRRGVGEMAEVVANEDFGILLDDVTPETLKTAFEQLQNPDVLRRLQANSSRAGRERYNWSVAEKRLAALFEELVTRR